MTDLGTIGLIGLAIFLILSLLVAMMVICHFWRGHGRHHH